MKITIYLVVLFLAAQFAGLLVTNQHISHRSVTDEGRVVIRNATTDLAFGTERPETTSPLQTLVFILGAILFGTVILLVLIKFNLRGFWKGWFYLAVVMTITYSLASFINDFIALALGLIMAYFKIIRPKVFIHNASEILIYGALGAIFVPMIYMNLYVVTLLLILISFYDMFAVWKSKHMVKLANFQTESKVFAGLLIPYGKKQKSAPKPTEVKGTVVESKVKNAILGGGDIAFPLLFSGVVMKGLMLTYPVALGFLLTTIISVTTAIALLILLVKADKGKFYPAMPFLSAGCFSGYAIIFLITHA